MEQNCSDARGSAMRLAIIHRRMIEAYAYAITRDFQLVDDVYQEVALVVIANWKQVPESEGALLWLKEVTRRKALELLRKQVRAGPLLSQEALQQVEAALPIQTENNLADAMSRCLEKLSSDARQAIQCRYAENLAVPEIAKRLGRTIQGAYAVLKRARMNLETCVNRVREQKRAKA